MNALTASELGTNIVKLLDMITNRTSCTACGRTIWFVRMKSGKLNPITADGGSHYADCTHAKQFRHGDSAGKPGDLLP